MMNVNNVKIKLPFLVKNKGKRKRLSTCQQKIINGKWVSDEDPSINWASGKRQNVIAKRWNPKSIPENSKGTKKEDRQKAHDIWAKPNKAQTIKKYLLHLNAKFQKPNTLEPSKRNFPNADADQKKPIAQNTKLNIRNDASQQIFKNQFRNKQNANHRISKCKRIMQKADILKCRSKKKRSQSDEQQRNPDPVRHLFNLQKRR